MSQVILRSENPYARSPDAVVFLKKVESLFVVALKTQATNAAVSLLK